MKFLLRLIVFLMMGSAYAQSNLLKDCADCPEMVVIPAGSFAMGSPYEFEADSRPVRRVNIAGFLLGKTEVTQGQWRAVMGNNPSHFSQCGDDCPVVQVTWNDAQDFARRLSQKTGKQYRLPSEAEWEYAARAGSSTKWSFGDNESHLGEYAWFVSNSQNRTQRVAQKKPNAFGLFDMHGNVYEWVEDCWHDNYTGAPTDGSAWTTGCSSSNPVLRGGSWTGYSRRTCARSYATRPRLTSAAGTRPVTATAASVCGWPGLLDGMKNSFFGSVAPYKSTSYGR